MKVRSGVRTVVYSALFSLILFGCVATVRAASQSGAVTVGGVVPGPPPGTPSTIDTPFSPTTSKQKNITASGTCQTGLVVRLFRSGVFAGAGSCQADSHYALNLDLADGRNDLVARQYDALDQSSPDSDTTVAYFEPPVDQAAASAVPSAANPQTPDIQLVMDHDYNFQGVTVGTPVHLPVHFTGGTGPYAVSVTWGGGNVSLMSRENAEQLFVDHAYDTPGTYTVKIRVSDVSGKSAYLQFVLLVNGVPSHVAFLGIPVGNVVQNGFLPTLTWGTVSLGTVTFGIGFIIARFGSSVVKFLVGLFVKTK